MKPKPISPPPKAGEYVRFKHLPKNVEPAPLLVTHVHANGMIRLLGWAGDFAPHLFVVVDGPKEAA